MLTLERTGNVDANIPHFHKRRITCCPRDAEVGVGDVDPAPHGEVVLACSGQLIGVRTDDGPRRIHAHDAVGNVECKAQVNRLFAEHLLFVQDVGDFQMVQAVDNPQFPGQLAAAWRLRLDRQRRDERSAVSDSDLRAGVALDVFGFPAWDVEVVVQLHSAIGSDQVDGDGLGRQAGNSARVLVNGGADPPVAQCHSFGSRASGASVLARLEEETLGAQRRDVVGQQRQFAGRQPLRWHDFAIRRFHDVSGDVNLWRQHNQVRTGPRRCVVNINGRHRLPGGRLPGGSSLVECRLQQLAGLRFGVSGKGLFDGPLVFGQLAVRLADAAVSPPCVLVVQDHVAPGIVKAIAGKLGRFQDRPQRFRLNEPFGGPPCQGRLACRGTCAVFPIGSEVALDFGNLLAVAAFEFLEHLARCGNDDLRVFILGIPSLDELGQLRVGRPIVAANAVTDLDHVVGITSFGQLGQILEKRAFGGIADDVQAAGVEPRVGLAGHPAQDAFPARWRDPIEGPIAPFRERIPDAVNVVRSNGKVLDATVGQGRHDAPGISRHVADHGGVDGQAVLVC